MPNDTDSLEVLRHLPKVDRLLASAPLLDIVRAYPRGRVVAELRLVLDDLRRRARRGSLGLEDVEAAAITTTLERQLERRARPYYRRVINATGVILHTGLGRAVLAPSVAEVVRALAVRPQRLEIDLETGERGGRDQGCDQLLRDLVGCEAATVVNNNAAATLLILAALARGKRVLLSRGELVEIGGSYRIPEIMKESGARLVEVGTTNRTHEADYRRALEEDEAGMILKVHTSNYRVVGFTKEVCITDLAALGKEHGVALVHDLGSGCLLDLKAPGPPGEDLVRASIEAGADLVCFSGDKLLGGPQAGIIAGRREAVERCRRHPLFRTLRPGRLIYTALEATLRLYQGDDPVSQIPALRQLTADLGELQRRADQLLEQIGAIDGLEVEVVEGSSQAGSGSLPARDYPSWAVRIVRRAGGVNALAQQLRSGDPAILARVKDDAILLDLRTLEDDELPLIGERLREIAEVP